MDHMRILRRALEITRAYRILWLFGFLVALTTSRGGSGAPGGGNNGVQYRTGPRDFPPNFPYIPQPTLNSIIGIAIGVACVILLLAVIFTLLRYVANTALIRMVNDYETTGEQYSIRQGFRLGWSRAAFRMWLVDLLFGLGGFLVFVLLLMIGAAPLLLLLTKNQPLSVIGIVMTIGLELLVIFLIVVVAIVLSVLTQFFHRAVVIDNMGVFEAIRRGWNVARGRFGDVVIMALILFGIGLAFGLVMIPIAIAVFLVSGLAGGLPGLLVYWITSLFSHGALPIILGVVVGLPIFLLLLIIPLDFIGGLMEVFTSSTWTLTYREAVAMESVQEPA